jgi:hypothetical protein
MIFCHLFNYGAINFSFIFQNGWFLHFDLCKYATIHTISYIHLDLYKYVTKKLKLQNSIWFSLLKLNNDPLHFRKTYLAHFKTNLNNFCDFECAKCRTTIWVIVVALNVLSVELQFFLRLKNNRVMIKDIELQIKKWFY